MKKILRFIGTISALFLSLFGITACFGNEAVSLYGVPAYMEEDGKYKNENLTPTTSGDTINNNKINDKSGDETEDKGNDISI